MCKVLLVDDEALARAGLLHFFDWDKNGYRIVGEASNGQKAMKWVEKQEVDILITDISMPVMDGLELTRWTRKVSPHTKIILISSYNDFEYAREGMRLGASDYLLKPTLENENLSQMLEKVRQQIMEEREKHGVNHDKRSAEEKTLLLWLSDETQANGSIEWLENGCRICVCSMDNILQMKKSGGYLEFIIDEALDMAYRYFEHGVAVRGAFDQIVLLLPIDAEQRDTAGMEPFRNALEGLGVSFTIGVSMPLSRPLQISGAYKQALQAVERRFFEGHGAIYLYSPISEPRNVQAAGSFRTQQAIFKTYVCDGFQQKAEECLFGIVNQWRFECKTVSGVNREAQELLCLLHALNSDSIQLVERLSSLRNLETAEEVKEWILGIFSDFRSGRKPVESTENGDNNIHHHIIAKAIDYIQCSYAEPISLQDVARRVNMSKNYFSEVFKKVTGQNFIDYLIQLRLNRSKVLLQDPQIKVYEVSEMAGFGDVKYFSKLFKKFMQISPTEYRENFFRI